MEINTAPEAIWREYQDGLSFNQRIGLEATVKTNNNFYNDRQWEGLNAPDMDKPCINIIKPAVNYYVSQLVSDDIGASIEIENSADIMPQPAGSAPNILPPPEYLAKIMQQAISTVLEQTEAGYKHRLLLKRMALDGDMVLYSYFASDGAGGGSIKTEIINNTDIFFGNPASGDVEEQPYIIIRQRKLLREVQAEAARNEGGEPENINADNEYRSEEDESKQYVTVLTKFFKAKNKQAADAPATVHYIRCTEQAYVKPETDLEYRRYPIAFESWERERENYHGVSPVTGKINNQIVINKLYALAALDRQNFSFPKVLYDELKLPDGWNSDPGVAVSVHGDPREAIFADFRPADMSGQVMQLIGDLAQRTNDSMGIYDAALGNAKPDNTSAILAVQQAAATPLELQRQGFYRFVENCVRIWLEIISVDYGTRPVSIEQTGADGKSANIPTMFDYRELARLQYNLKIDIGAAARWSALLQVQMLDSLFKAGILTDPEIYLECLPDGYLKNRATVLQSIRDKKEEAAALAAQSTGAPAASAGAAQMFGGVD